MEGKDPCRVPGILPLVRHRDDFTVVHVMPLRVARRAVASFELSPGMLFEPSMNVIVVVLLRPKHPGQGLPHDIRPIRTECWRSKGPVELVRIFAPRRNERVEAISGGCGLSGRL